MKKNIIWLLSFLLTLSVAYYQRITGPTHPGKYIVSIRGTDYRLNLPRSHGGPKDKIISLPVPDKTVNGILIYRRYPTTDPWDTITFTRTDDFLTASLPVQPPAGKLEYIVILDSEDQQYTVDPDDPVIIRFKGDVPAAVLIPHILLIFAAMLISSITGLYAIFRLPSYKFYGILTLCLLIAGGLILGPVIQNYAFGDLWTGFPLGKDLTDNKILAAFIFWMIAVAGNFRKDRPWLSWLASVFFLLVTLIPHSMFGSELDYQSGEVITGLILFNW
jgi:hypothetical protein